MFMSEWREFSSAPCLAGNKLDDSSRLDVVEIVCVPDILPSMFPFLAGLKTYQHTGNPGYILCRMITNAELEGLWQRVFLGYIRLFRSIQVRETDITVLIFRAM